MSVAFWSVKLTNGKASEVQPPEGYVLNVQQAAMTGDGNAVVKVHTTSVEGDKLEAVICTLRNKTCEQMSMSLVFGYDVPVAFSSEGNGVVYLSGYYQPGPEEDDENDYDDMDEDDEDDEDDSEDDDEEDDEEESGDEEQNIKNAEAAIAKLGAARSKDLVVSGKKASKQQLESGSEDEEDDDEEDSEDEDDSEEERIDQKFIAKMVARNGLAPKSSRVEELDAGSDSEEEDDEDDEDDESSEEEPPVKVQKTQPKGVVTQKPQQGGNNSKPNTPAAKPQQSQGSKPNTPAAKPQQNNQQGQNKQTPNKPQGGNNGQQGQNKTPNTNGKPQHQQGSGFKSGDKRKR